MNWFRSFCCLTGIIVLLLGVNNEEVFAVGAGEELTAEYDQSLPMTVYRLGNVKNPLPNQPVFRTNGKYEWKWMSKENNFGDLIHNGNGTYYYYDYSNIVHAITSENEELWTLGPMENKIDSMSILKNGNLFLKMTQDESRIKIIGSKEQTATTISRILLIGPEGNIVLDQMNFDPNKPPTNVRTIDDRFVFITDEGLICYNSNGEKVWSIKDYIQVAQDKLMKQWYTNVDSLSHNIDGSFHLYTTDGIYRKIDSNGTTIATERAFLTEIKVAENKYAIVTQGDDGLYWWRDQRLTEEEIRTVLQNKPALPFWTSREITWTGGSYSTTSETNNLIAKDSDGNILWTYFTPESQYGHPYKVIANQYGDVFFCDFGGNIYGLDSEGNELFRLIRNNRSITSVDLELTPDGGILGVTEDINMFRIAKIIGSE
jgi:hypothetical protein